MPVGWMPEKMMRGRRFAGASLLCASTEYFLDVIAFEVQETLKSLGVVSTNRRVEEQVNIVGRFKLSQTFLSPSAINSGYGAWCHTTLLFDSGFVGIQSVTIYVRQ